MQNVLALAPAIATTSSFGSCAGQGRSGLVDYRDVAAVASEIITSPARTRQKTCSLTGPELFQLRRGHRAAAGQMPSLRPSPQESRAPSSNADLHYRLLRDERALPRIQPAGYVCPGVTSARRPPRGRECYDIPRIFLQGE